MIHTGTVGPARQQNLAFSERLGAHHHLVNRAGRACLQAYILGRNLLTHVGNFFLCQENAGFHSLAPATAGDLRHANPQE